VAVRTLKMAVRTRSRSVVWCFFRKVSSKEATCEDCGDSIATCGNTTNLFKVSRLVRQHILLFQAGQLFTVFFNPIAFKVKAP